MFLSASDHIACSSCSCFNTPNSKGDYSGLANSGFDSRRVFTISTSNLTVMLVLIPFFTHVGVTIGKLDSMKFNGLVQSEYFFILPPFENTVINKTERFSFLSVITIMILSYFGSSVLIS